MRRAFGVGVAAAQISACAHEDVDDHFKFLVSVIFDLAGGSFALERSHVSCCDIVEMPLIAVRREHLGLIEDAKEFRHLAHEVEESAKALGLPVRPRRQRAGACGNEIDHLAADGRQQLVEQFLPVFEVVVEGSLSDFGKLGDACDRRFRIAEMADHFGGGIEQPLLDLVIALGPAEFGLGIPRSADTGHRVRSDVRIS